MFPEVAQEQFISWVTRLGAGKRWLSPLAVSPQDLGEAVSVVELQQELGLQAVATQREVFLLAASIAPAGPGFEDPGTVHIWRLLLELLS